MKDRCRAGGYSRIERPTGLALGYRAVRDIAVYMQYASQLKSLFPGNTAIDLQVCQRILPKLRGDERLKNVLYSLHALLKEEALVRSQRRLEQMLSHLEDDQYVSFWT